MVFNVSAGHNPDGMVACGAIGIVKESTEARIISDEVIRLLRALGHTAHDCTVNNGTSANNVLTNIVKKCNEHESDLDVFIHLNVGRNDYSGDGSVGGTENFVYSRSSEAVDAAIGIANAMKELGYRLRSDGTSPAPGVKVNAKFYVLRKTKAPAVLIEVCFIDDKDDMLIYDAKKAAEAIVFGITGQRYVESTNEEYDNEASEEGAESATGDKEALYRVQAGAYRNINSARDLADQLRVAGFDAAIVKA